MNLTDRGEVKRLLDKYGLAPKKGRGQNFLANANVVYDIADLCGDEDRCVIEIGPGVGAMTAELCKMYKKVLAIEVDSDLIPLLSEALGEYENLEIIEADAMNVDFVALVREKFPGDKVSVCANLPYYITSPVIMRLLDASGVFESIVVMIQKEVADRLCSAPGTAGLGAITVAVDYKAEAKKCFTVSAGNFIPPPKVTSAVVRMKIRENPPVSPVSVDNMFALIRAAFAQRRKTFSNAVRAVSSKYSKEEIESALVSLGLPADVRGERLGLSEYAALSDILPL